MLREVMQHYIAMAAAAAKQHDYIISTKMQIPEISGTLPQHARRQLVTLRLQEIKQIDCHAFANAQAAEVQANSMLVAAPQTQVLLAAPVAAARPFSSCRRRRRHSTQRATRVLARQQSGGEPSDAGSRPATLPVHRRLLSGVAAAGLAAALALTPASQSFAADAAKVLQ